MNIAREKSDRIASLLQLLQGKLNAEHARELRNRLSLSNLTALVQALAERLEEPTRHTESAATSQLSGTLRLRARF